MKLKYIRRKGISDMEERYTELFQNVYGAKNEHPLNKIEEKREEIKDIVKEGLGMLNKAREMAFGIDETEMQDDITNALNIFLAAEEKQQELPPGKNLFVDCTDKELLIKFDGKVYRIINSGEVVPNIKTIINKLKKVPSQYRMIPNDTMNIEADSFERELYIDLNERK